MFVRRFSSSSYPVLFSMSAMVIPVVSSIGAGTVFTGIILKRIHHNDTQLMKKLYEIEEEVKKIKR